MVVVRKTRGDALIMRMEGKGSGGADQVDGSFRHRGSSSSLRQVGGGTLLGVVQVLLQQTVHILPRLYPNLRKFTLRGEHVPMSFRCM